MVTPPRGNSLSGIPNNANHEHPNIIAITPPGTS